MRQPLLSAAPGAALRLHEVRSDATGAARARCSVPRMALSRRSPSPACRRLRYQLPLHSLHWDMRLPRRFTGVSLRAASKTALSTRSHYGNRLLRSHPRRRHTAENSMRLRNVFERPKRNCAVSSDAQMLCVREDLWRSPREAPCCGMETEEEAKGVPRRRRLRVRR